MEYMESKMQDQYDAQYAKLKELAPLIDDVNRLLIDHQVYPEDVEFAIAVIKAGCCIPPKPS